MRKFTISLTPNSSTSKPEWQTVRLPWDAFKPFGIKEPLRLDGMQRFGLLGWMRDFDADVAVARIGLY